MKLSRSIAKRVCIIVMLLFRGVSLAETSVTTIPVGFIKLTIAGALDVSTPSCTPASIPFYGQALYVGKITSVSGPQSLSVKEPGWIVNQFTSSPTYCRIKTGAATGAFFLVSSNTNSQLNLNMGLKAFVSSPAANSQQLQVVAGDQVEVVPANTLGGIFGFRMVPFQTGIDASTADNILFFNGTNWSVYYHNGNGWRAPGATTDQSETIIPPDEAVMVLRRGLTSLTIYFSGVVPSTQELLFLPHISRFVGSRFPVNMTLRETGIQLNSGWLTGISAARSDNLLMWNQEARTWDNFFYDGIRWRKAGSFLSWDEQPIPAGSGVFIIRKNTTAETVITFPLPYVF